MGVSENDYLGVGKNLQEIGPDGGVVFTVPSVRAVRTIFKGSGMYNNLNGVRLNSGREKEERKVVERGFENIES